MDEKVSSRKPHLLSRRYHQKWLDFIRRSDQHYLSINLIAFSIIATFIVLKYSLVLSSS